MNREDLLATEGKPYTVTVVGATGKTGREVVREALAHGWQVRAAARRDPDRGEWVVLDWDDEATWVRAFEGSDAAYTLIPFNHPTGAERTPRMLKVAAEVGVQRIVLLSSWDAAHASNDGPLRVAETTLEALPVNGACLRPTWFMDNFTTGSFAGMTQAGELRLPAGRARIPFIDVRDIAAVAVAAMSFGGPEGAIPLTGPCAIDHHEVAAALGAASGVPLTYSDVPAEEFIEGLMARGFSRDYGEFLAEALLEVASGRLRIPVSDFVEQILGRPPHSIEGFAAHHAEAKQR